MKNKAFNQIQDLWSSKWAFILAATGAAVGLGNIWRFPYMAGQNGGSAFVVLYLIFVLIMGIPIMISEFIIGRRARQNPVDALTQLAAENQKTPRWGLLGWWGALALLMILSFYSVVSGWSIAYIFKSLSGQFRQVEAQQVIHIWQSFLADPWQLLGWHTVFMCLTMGVIALGITQGLERATKFMMPALYLILIGLVFYAANVGNLTKAVAFLFSFDYHKITASVVIAAMGHAFFTLALGAGALLTYGAYIPKKVNIISSVFIIVLLDVLVAFLSGLAIFPIVFKFHLPLTSGPGLMFESLPVSFNLIKMGSIVGGLFFILLLFAAWTSAINIAEPLIIISMKKLKLTRIKATILIGFLAWTLGIGSLLSFNAWQTFHLFNHYTLFDVVTNIPTDFILPIGGVAFAIFAGYVMRRDESFKEINTHTAIYRVWRFLVRYIAPVAAACIFLGALF